MAYREYFPESMIELQKELRNWPLISKEAMDANLDTVGTLGVIAARLGILLDGVYDIPDLCAMLLKKLREMRTTNLILPDSRTQNIRIRAGENEVIIEDVPNPSKPGE